MRTWAMRGTLHLVATEDLAWQAPLFAERELEWSRRRLADVLGVGLPAQRRAVRAIGRLLEADGVVTRGQVLARLEAERIAFDRQTAGHHLPRLAVLEGVACLGPDRGTGTSFVLARDWIGDPGQVERERGIAELGRRYLAAFGPAGERDMAAWSGLGIRECRAALDSIAAELTEVRVGGEAMAILRGSKRRRPETRMVRLVPGFDNYLLGHRDRAFAVRPEHAKRVSPGGGIIRPTVILDGRVVGTWGTRRSRRAIRVVVDLFAPVDGELIEGITGEVDDIGRFEGRTATLDIEKGG